MSYKIDDFFACMHAKTRVGLTGELDNLTEIGQGDKCRRQ